MDTVNVHDLNLGYLVKLMLGKHFIKIELNCLKFFYSHNKG